MAKTVFQYGNRRCSITFYNESKKLPVYVLQLIQHTYLVCRIISARMIETHPCSRRQTQFLVQLEDDQFVRFVRICDGRIELIKQLSKN